MTATIVILDHYRQRREPAPQYEARDCFATTAEDAEIIRRNAWRTQAAMDRLAYLPSDTEPE